MKRRITDVLSPGELDAVRELESEVKQHFQTKRVSLFGSVAREEADENSDLDLLIILSETVTHRLRNSISDIVFEVNLKHGTNISVIIFDEETWSSAVMKLTPFYSEVVREEVPIYEA
jgi:predicted nucleotidyltransferase